MTLGGGGTKKNSDPQDNASKVHWIVPIFGLTSHQNQYDKNSSQSTRVICKLKTVNALDHSDQGAGLAKGWAIEVRG